MKRAPRAIEPTPNRPMTSGGSCASTPLAAEMIDLLGSGFNAGGVAMSPRETLAVGRLYNRLDLSKEKGDVLIQAGHDMGVIRDAERDGKRIVAWLAKHVEPGEDPLKLVIRMAIEFGLEVEAPDVDWCGYGDEE